MSEVRDGERRDDMIESGDKTGSTEWNLAKIRESGNVAQTLRGGILNPEVAEHQYDPDKRSD